MPAAEQVWIVEDDRSIRWVLEKALQQGGLTTRSFDSADAVLREAGASWPQVLISDIRMPGMDGLALLEQLRSQRPELRVIIMTAHSDLDSAIDAYRGGAFEYLPKPFDVDEAVVLVRRAIAQARPAATPPAAEPGSADRLVGEAPAMQDVFRTIGRLSQSEITVLITGESGTGKELVARALHRHSPRAHGPLIALNVAAIPRELVEAELFGHEKGAFTGAGAQRQGRFEQAAGGTLFLDEIGDMPLDAQTRLLRVLSEGSFHRVGGLSSIRADVRIIAATHQDLETLVRQGRFREDLFYRLNVIRIRLPALRERREDIARLAEFFLHKAASELRMEPRVLLPQTQAHLRQLTWPGNVRQLENACRWITVMSASREVHVGDLPPELQQPPAEAAADDAAPGSTDAWERALAQWAGRALAQGRQPLLDEALPAFERTLITVALQHSAGGRRDAAELLGWGRNTLTRKMKELGMDEDAPAGGPPPA
ncbi:MAG: nitrogen regulation protein NR(I) [Burkholderiales bacterium]|nr:nitrogen regulation protein NR(I) [Burkholderiales bacterium]